MSLSQYLSEVPTLGLFANSEPRSTGRPELALSLPKGPGCRALLGRAGEGTRLYVYRSLALATLLLLTLSFARRGAAQITVSPDFVNGVHTEGDTHLLPGGPYCSLQEAIYATEFGQNVALDQTNPDNTYTSGCTDNSAAWNVIDLPGGTLTFSGSWGGDAHNPFGPTATPIIFSTITINGHGTTLEPTAGAVNFRLFAIGQATIPAAGQTLTGVVTTGTYSGTGNLTLTDVYVLNFHVKGGDGACGGGGGLGAGGAIYIGKVSSVAPALNIENSTFENNSANGGNGAPYLQSCSVQKASDYHPGGGGGGLYGNGGMSFSGDYGNGSGGGGGARGNGGSGSDAAGGGGGGTVYSGDAAFPDPNINLYVRGGPGGYLCGGSGADANNDSNSNNNPPASGQSAICSGGGGGGAAVGGTGGNGQYGGGGGGSGFGKGGNGGFGGGGGATCAFDQTQPVAAGKGGFGGGGGAALLQFVTNGPGGAFAGSGGNVAGFGFGGSGGALGGAIFNDGGTVAIANTTFAGNSLQGGLTPANPYYPAPPATNGLDAGGAVFSRNGSLTVENATISGNTTSATATGGGIVVMSDGAVASFKLDNTILANNGTQECYLVNSVGWQGAGNLIMANDPTHGCPGVVQTTNPQLGALTLNAPGDTPTMAIQFGSSAVDNGNDTALASDKITTDQRGAPRPQGAHSDIGAYEAPPPSADLSVTKSVSSSTAQPGDTIIYTLNVNNAGPNTANNVSVSDTLPTAYVTFVSCTESTGTGTCTYNGTAVTVAYASLAANASSSVTINTTVNSAVTDGVSVGNNASVSDTDPTDPNTANNTSANVYFTIHNKADLAVTKSVSSTSQYWPTGIEVGDSLTYTVTLTNKGPYDAKSVVLSDSAPAGVTFTGCTASVGTCVWSASGASLSLSSFTNASVAILTIQAKVNFGVADGSMITNTASVTSTTNDPDPTNNAGSASFTVLNKSDLFLMQTVGKLVNQQLTFTVSVKNLGPYQAKQLLLNDAMPNGTNFISVAQGPWTCTPLPVNSTGTLSCTVSTLNLNATDSLSFTVKVTTTGKNISNTATVSAATFDPNLANNTATLVTKSGAGK